MSKEQERKNKTIALFSTLGIHGLILLLTFFIIAWKAPDPPLGGLGVDLNIGLDFEGSGDVQPEEPVGANQLEAEKNEESKPEQPVEEVTEVVKPVDTKAEEGKLATGNDEESTVIAKEKKDEVKPVEKPKEKEKVEEKPAAVYKPSNNATNKANGEKSSQSNRVGTPGSQGDDLNKTGDKGDPRGTVEGKAMYGNPGTGGNGAGGSGGSSIEIAGWQWDEMPVVTVSENESGRIVFEIKVDENGDVTGIRRLEGSVSAATEQACRKQVEKLTFTKIGSNVPAVTTGKITFVIHAR